MEIEDGQDGGRAKKESKERDVLTEGRMWEFGLLFF